MKLIVTGSTGLVGKEVLFASFSHPAIDSMVAISRKPLDTSHPNLQVVLHEDFAHYSEETLAALKGAEACIYALGTVSPSQPDYNRRVNMEYSLVAASAFAESAAAEEEVPICIAEQTLHRERPGQTPTFHG